MMQPTCLGYCVLEVADLAAWKRFATEVVGMQAGRAVPDRSLALRVDDRTCRVLLMRGPADDIAAAGWEFPTQQALEDYVARLRQKGIEVREGGDDLAASREVRKLYVCRDPDGWSHELYFAPGVAPSTSAFSSTLVRGGFSAGRLGVGHIVAVPKDGSRSKAFYRDALDFSVSDYIRAETELVANATLEATFFHVSAGRHHSIAVAEFPGYPKSLAHLMLEANDLSDVGMAFDRFVAAGIPILSSIGQHPNDRMVSFYAATPSGFAIEIGWGGVVIDDSKWTVRSYSQASLWGHKAPAPSKPD